MKTSEQDSKKKTNNNKQCSASLIKCNVNRRSIVKRTFIFRILSGLKL